MTLINLFFRDAKLDVDVRFNVQGSNLSKTELEGKADTLFRKVHERSILPKWIEKAIAKWRITAINSSINQHLSEMYATKIVCLLKDYKNGNSIECYKGVLSEDKIRYVLNNSERIEDILIHYNVIKLENNKIELDFKNIKKVAKYLTETIDGELLLEKHGENYIQLRASNKNELLQSLSEDSEPTGFFYQGKKELELMDKAYANRFIQKFFKEFSPRDCEMIFKAISHKLAKRKNWDNGITADLIRQCLGNNFSESLALQKFATMFDDHNRLVISIISQIKKENPKIFAELGMRNRNLQLFDLIGKDFVTKLPKNTERENNVVENSVLMNPDNIQPEGRLSDSFDNPSSLNSGLIDNYSFPQKNTESDNFYRFWTEKNLILSRNNE